MAFPMKSPMASAAPPPPAVVAEMEEVARHGAAETPGTPDAGPGLTHHGQLASHHGMLGAHYRSKAAEGGPMGEAFGRLAEHHKAIATEHAGLAEAMPDTNPKNALIQRVKKAAVRRGAMPEVGAQGPPSGPPGD
jgi:hypothetical protein